jgi:hypothetical protein
MEQNTQTNKGQTKEYEEVHRTGRGHPLPIPTLQRTNQAQRGRLEIKQLRKFGFGFLLTRFAFH